MFNKSSVKLFNENGYKVEQSQDSIIIKHSSSDRYIMILIGILIILSSLFLMLFSLILGIIVLIGSILILIKSGQKTIGKSSLKLNLKERWFESIEERWGRMVCFFDDIHEIEFYSKFFDEYASANKVTTEEYTHDIILKLHSSHKIRLFRFEGDYSEPSKAEKELVDQLKKIFKRA